ncbi:NUDIX hydrolase [Defluviitalea saccharophila]|uniref:NUDIX hydrolase n=1 Tax=Defluviitalea saccharophila TaxID=879970 RepID=A0ABZ2YAV1_9FIRM
MSHIVYENEYFQVFLNNNVLSLNNIKGGAAILPLTIDKKVILMKIFRKNINQDSWEIPGGFTEKGEESNVTAQREMLEEISCISQEIISLGYMYTDTGLMNSKVYLYLGKDTSVKKDQLQTTEGVKSIRLVDFEDAYNMALDGEINDSYTLVAILRSKKYVDEL